MNEESFGQNRLIINSTFLRDIRLFFICNINFVQLRICSKSSFEEVCMEVYVVCRERRNEVVAVIVI